jgi:hypothetical protein
MQWLTKIPIDTPAVNRGLYSEGSRLRLANNHFPEEVRWEKRCMEGEGWSKGLLVRWTRLGRRHTV